MGSSYERIPVVEAQEVFSSTEDIKAFLTISHWFVRRRVRVAAGTAGSWKSTTNQDPDHQKAEESVDDQGCGEDISDQLQEVSWIPRNFLRLRRRLCLERPDGCAVVTAEGYDLSKVTSTLMETGSEWRSRH